MDLSLVIPCYNEALYLKNNFNALVSVLKQTSYEFEIIFVDDCSTDNTKEIIGEISNSSHNCKAIFNLKNLGRGTSFKQGFSVAEGRIIGFIDIDLEIAPHYILDLISKIDKEGFDLSLGRRFLFYGFQKPIRNIFSLLCRYFCSLVLGTQNYDTQVGCKFFNGHTARPSILESKSSSWFWDTEVIFMAQLNKLKIVDIPVRYRPLKNKKSTVRIIPDTIKFIQGVRELRRKMGLSLSNRSPIYWSNKGYNFIMQLLTGKSFQQSFSKVAELIPESASVIDVCCGTGEFYYKHLKQKNCDYRGLDYNYRFVKGINKRGVKSNLSDVRYEKIPACDYVVMVSSFYHFKKQKNEILKNMRASAQKAVIISEPVHNFSRHRIGFVSKVAVMLSKPGEGEYMERFNLKEFQEFAQAEGATEFYFNSKDKNAIAVFKT
ncbi:MAG: glycosyltransferase [Oligoflexia bacterium]|nr:glycosyltransferase [Oligoflexia bacterium]